jgi:hypothetical protein
MKLSQIGKGLFITRVCFGDLLGVEKENAWVELRETNEDEAFGFKPGDKTNPQVFEENTKILRKLWKKCLVIHNFENEDGSDMTNEEVIDFIKSHSSILLRVIDEWQAKLNLRQGKDETSNESQD